MKKDLVMETANTFTFGGSGITPVTMEQVPEENEVKKFNLFLFKFYIFLT